MTGERMDFGTYMQDVLNTMRKHAPIPKFSSPDTLVSCGKELDIYSTASTVLVPGFATSGRTELIIKHDFRRVSPALQRTNRISRIRVPGNINGIPVDALPDTGADDCYIDAAFARKGNLDILPTSKKRIVLGSGKTIKPVGEVRATWKFRSEHEAHPLVLYVLKTLADTNLALGSLFLKATKTFTEHRSRISRTANGVSSRKPPLKFHLLGGGTDRIRGYLDGTEVCALPDTGSQIMAMSTAMALRQKNCKIDTSPENRIRVQYADGSTKLARGLARGLDWDFGIQDEPQADCGLYCFDDPSPVHAGVGVGGEPPSNYKPDDDPVGFRVRGESVNCNCYVLDDLPVDVILGADFAPDLGIGGEPPSNYKLDDDPVGFRVQGRSVNCDFYVLDDLPVDVILSADFVLDLGVFMPKYEACFLPAAAAAAHGSESGGLGVFCNIRIVKKWFKRAFRRPRNTAHTSASSMSLLINLPLLPGPLSGILIKFRGGFFF
ncbi:hypothetical protein MAPG_08579 [Magnaporthiopsis poae ATCC 64411]|uniref:Uncharacterized protein n=1 Tax=Magnaporthiopsis poae (strain ATCC 64411 / 73-15) TaxID=644358 RepID=A0A0C4E7Q9_MAGP6|nr:hypothetical protein MAPG_08579 [Magnaporthiopsis poae ATCC 64411]